MNTTYRLTSPLQSVFWSKNHSVVRQLLLLLPGMILLIMSAQLRIPWGPVPLTLQSTTVILIGMMYGARLGTYIISAYLLAGLCGLPIFEGFTMGWAKIIGPTGGYLVGFLPAVIVSGYLAQRGWAKNIISSFIAGCLGIGIIFLCGISVLSFSIGWQKAIIFGIMPFIISEPVKLIAVSCLAPLMWKRSLYR